MAALWAHSTCSKLVTSPVRVAKGRVFQPRGARLPVRRSAHICAGKLQADAAAAAGVKVFQFTPQEDVEKRTQVSAQPREVEGLKSN